MLFRSGVQVGPAQVGEVRLVGGGVGRHHGGQQGGELLGAHIEAEGVPEGLLVDVHRGAHLADELGQGILQRRANLLLKNIFKVVLSLIR